MDSPLWYPWMSLTMTLLAAWYPSQKGGLLELLVRTAWLFIITGQMGPFILQRWNICNFHLDMGGMELGWKMWLRSYLTKPVRTSSRFARPSPTPWSIWRQGTCLVLILRKSGDRLKPWIPSWRTYGKTRTTPCNSRQPCLKIYLEIIFHSLTWTWLQSRSYRRARK